MTLGSSAFASVPASLLASNRDLSGLFMRIMDYDKETPRRISWPFAPTCRYTLTHFHSWEGHFLRPVCMGSSWKGVKWIMGHSSSLT
jgi:hypothetical protein